MQVITFYSYKGGVGRTLTCANFGLYLAKTGQKVVLADMDFEAPGLDSKFASIDTDKVSGGLLDQFIAFQQGVEPPKLNAIEIPLSPDVTKAGGQLHVIPAGNYLAPDYFKRLSSINWEELLETPHQLALCLQMIKRIEEAYGADVLVIDSRTGLTEVGGLCTQFLPDTAILLTSTSRESLKGIQRVYERIQTSPIVAKRLHGRTQVDVRIVISRIPRPDDLPAYDQRMRNRLGLPVDRLYYLFDQRDLCLDEYLALERIDDHPAILDDYVELFTSFNPEITTPYIQARLDDFRTQITRRSPRENERIIQEILLLFPRAEVFLEAGRYYRLVKEETLAFRNYLRYLEIHEDDAETLAEFAVLCEKVPPNELRPPEKIDMLLWAYGVDRMGLDLLKRFVMITGEEGRRAIIELIQGDEQKKKVPEYREILKRAIEAGESTPFSM